MSLVRALLCLIAAGGCTSASIQPSYFSLDPSEVDAGVPSGEPTYPVQLRVRRFNTTLAYDRQEIVYRTNAYALQFYWYRLWVAKPSKMLTELVAAKLRRSGLFKEVVMSIGDRLPDYELAGDILSIEELDSTDKLWFGQMSVRFTLLRFKDKVSVWEHVFDVKKAVYQRDPVYVVKALSDILGVELERLVRGLDAQLATLTGLPPQRPESIAPAGEATMTEPPPEPRAWLVK